MGRRAKSGPALVGTTGVRVHLSAPYPTLSTLMAEQATTGGAATKEPTPMVRVSGPTLTGALIGCVCD